MKLKKLMNSQLIIVNQFNIQNASYKIAVSRAFVRWRATPARRLFSSSSEEEFTFTSEEERDFDDERFILKGD